MTNKEIELLIENKVKEVQLFAQKEARKARDGAFTSFFRGIGIVSILLAIIGYFGITEIAKKSVDDFLKNKGVNETLDSLATKKNVAQAFVDTARVKIKEVQEISKEVISILGRLPGIIDKKDAHVDGEYPMVNGSFPIPYIDGAFMERNIRINDTSDTYLVVFAYRVKSPANNLRYSSINILQNDVSVKQIVADVAEGKTTEFGSSGAVVVSKLQKGEYKISLEDYSDVQSDRKWLRNRQFTIYKLQ